jgi:AbrB family looped-hinge helix DNA binding protein
MTVKITIDKAGRIVIPKRLREKLQIGPGDTLQLDSEGDRITLRPIRPQATLRKEHGVWVYSGETTDASISDLIDRERDKPLGGLRR